MPANSGLRLQASEEYRISSPVCSWWGWRQSSWVVDTPSFSSSLHPPHYPLALHCLPSFSFSSSQLTRSWWLERKKKSYIRKIKLASDLHFAVSLLRRPSYSWLHLTQQSCNKFYHHEGIHLQHTPQACHSQIVDRHIMIQRIIEK